MNHTDVNAKNLEDDGKIGLSVYLIMTLSFLFWVGLIGLLLTSSVVFRNMMIVSVVCMLIIAIIGSFIN